MKVKQTAWSHCYQMALRKHLKQGPQSSLRPALELGRQAAALGLETLDVAKIHAEALAKLEPSSRSAQTLKRAEVFFTEAIAPIEDTHRAALKANRHVKQLTATLDRRTTGLAASKQYLKRRIAQRKGAEAALKKSGEHYGKLLEESYRLQDHLRHLTHRIISAQEHKRKKVSRELHDEIAQTLLGINIRLLALKNATKAHTENLKKEVAETQRLVKQSVKTINRTADEFGIHHES
ncbi:MAG TPA: hypothetical protein DCZ95_08670 [Verrucomicrobia bacterium]|nr:MAG: hypothetical protein A2X46_19285 [Lentisphaerae bacterium GWF2_57_35]HBA84152.1 hypothetical protein [Verrucomicrobiota bacterium]